MAITMLVLLTVCSYNELINHGLSERYLVMHCELSNDKYKYCHDLSDSVDLGRMSEERYPTVLMMHD